MEFADCATCMCPQHVFCMLSACHVLYAVLEELKSHSDAEEFVNFVSEKRAEDYYSVIDYPMCLNEIRDRINRFQCDSRAKVCNMCYIAASTEGYKTVRVYTCSSVMNSMLLSRIVSSTTVRTQSTQSKLRH